MDKPRGEARKFPQGTPYSASILMRRCHSCTLLSKQVENSIVSRKATAFRRKLNADVDSNVVFDQVLAVVNDGDVKVGTPVVEGAKVTAKVLAQGKEKKVLVFKYKAKSNYRRRQGHRQPFTKVAIEKIEG